MKTRFLLTLCTGMLLAACSPGAPVLTQEPIQVQYTAAAAPWLVSVYDCAGGTIVSTEQLAADFLDPQASDLAIRLGEPDPLDSPAYRIGSDDLLAIVSPQNPIQTLNMVQVRGLFDGQIQNWKEAGGPDSPVQVWAFSPAEDVQTIFNASVLDGSPVTSTARLASSPAEMILSVSKDAGAIGLLNRRLLTNRVTAASTVSSVPVLALTRSTPTRAVATILSCLQK